MVLQIVLTPAGKYSVFHHPTDSWVIEEVDLRILRDFFKMFVDSEVQEIVDALEADRCPYGPDALEWADLEKIFQEYNGPNPERPQRVGAKRTA